MAEPIPDPQSVNTPPSSTRRKPVLVHEERDSPAITEATLLTPETMSPPTMTPAGQKSDAYFVVFDAIARVLASRFIALVGIFGAIALAWRALGSPTLFELGVLAIYCVGLAGVVWLAGR